MTAKPRTDLLLTALPLILASASPRRSELLALLARPFTVEAADVDETPEPDESPGDLVARLATAKATIVAARRPGAIVIGSDTVVVAPSGVILGKPEDDAHAIAILSQLSGATHQVMTGFALATRQPDEPVGVPVRVIVEVAIAAVTFALIGPDDIAAYVATGEPNGKAGA